MKPTASTNPPTTVRESATASLPRAHRGIKCTPMWCRVADVTRISVRRVAVVVSLLLRRSRCLNQVKHLLHSRVLRLRERRIRGLLLACRDCVRKRHVARLRRPQGSWFSYWPPLLAIQPGRGKPMSASGAGMITPIRLATDESSASSAYDRGVDPRPPLTKRRIRSRSASSPSTSNRAIPRLTSRVR